MDAPPPRERAERRLFAMSPSGRRLQDISQPQPLATHPVDRALIETRRAAGYPQARSGAFVLFGASNEAPPNDDLSLSFGMPNSRSNGRLWPPVPNYFAVLGRSGMASPQPAFQVHCANALRPIS